MSYLMSRFSPVTYSEFIWLLTKAQSYHISQGEPIPGINAQGAGQVKYCLEAPFMEFGGHKFHKTFDAKASILFYDLCKLHCLLNGNKRMAVETTIFFAFKNSRYCFIGKKVLKDIAKKVVESDSAKKDEIVWWLERVFHGGIRKRTTWMTTKLVIMSLPFIIILLIKRKLKSSIPAIP